MLKYIAKRLLHLAGILIAVSFLTFLLMYLAPGDAAVKKGSYKIARQHYQAAAKADPLSYPAAICLAKAWLKSDSTADGQKKALESYRNACALKPGAIDTFLAAGALAYNLKMYAQAVEIYSRAVATAPYKLDAIDGLIRALRRAGGALLFPPRGLTLSVEYSPRSRCAVLRVSGRRAPAGDWNALQKEVHACFAGRPQPPMTFRAILASAGVCFAIGFLIVCLHRCL